MSADQNSHGITSAVGPYSLVAKQLSGQEKILAEYPYLWTVSDYWPIDDLQVTNDAGRFMKFMDKRCRMEDSLAVWVHGKQADESVYMMDVTPMRQKPPDNRRVHLPSGARWGRILGGHLHREIWAVVAVENDPDAFVTIVRNVILFRNKDRSKSLNPFIDIWQQANS